MGDEFRSPIRADRGRWLRKISLASRRIAPGCAASHEGDAEVEPKLDVEPCEDAEPKLDAEPGVDGLPCAEGSGAAAVPIRR